MWQGASLPAQALAAVDLYGADLALQSSFAVAAAVPSTLGAAALVAAQIGVLHGPARQRVAVDATLAVLDSCG